MRSTIALVLILLALALGFLHGAWAFKTERESALEELFPQASASGTGAKVGAGAGGAAPEPRGGVGSSTSTSTSASTSLGAGAAVRPGASSGAGAAGTGTAGAGPSAAPPEKDATEEEIQAVKSLLATGDERRKSGDYRAAREAHAEAAKRLTGMRSVVALPLARLAQRGEARAAVLGALAAAVPPNDFASGEKLRKLYLKSGREYVAKVLSMTGGQVSFRLANGIEISLPLGELAKPSDPCTKAEWRERCLSGLEERRGKTDEESGFELFRLAAFALENGLREEAAPILERALEKDKQGLLPEYFCDASARPSRTTVQLARGGTEAEVTAAVKGGGTSAGAGAGTEGATGGGGASGAEEGGEREEVLPPRPVEGKLLADARWRKSSQRLEEGIAHYRKSFRGSPDYEKELKAALAIFNEVATALDAMRQDFPESASLEAKILEVNQARVDCRKRSGT